MPRKEANNPPNGDRLRVAGLFSGIGGIEVGLAGAGHHVLSFCEIDTAARAVLSHHFPHIPTTTDIRRVDRLPDCQVLTAGFPCQDLSPAGIAEGIAGKSSSVVRELFRLVRKAKRKPRWILLENVPFMLRLQRGAAMAYLTQALEALGYRWAYRTVDTRAFGLPQRRQRVFMLASRQHDPRPVLFADDVGEPAPLGTATAFGFYWTEGNRGLGWAIDAVPTLKGGSGFGIPSPPAIWFPERRSIETPEIRDAERLQGFPPGWTEPAEQCKVSVRAVRWRLVGNSVSVPVCKWIGERLLAPGKVSVAQGLWESKRGWPRAAWGANGRVYSVSSSTSPVLLPTSPLLSFLKYPTKALSARASSGFLCRAKASSLNFTTGFLADVEWHLRQMDPDGVFPTDGGPTRRRNTKNNSACGRQGRGNAN